MKNQSSSPILQALTSNVRVITTTQASQLLASTKLHAKSVLRGLESRRLIERLGGTLLPKQATALPLYEWTAANPKAQPNFEALAYEAKKRRFNASEFEFIYRATRSGFKTVNSPKRPRPCRRTDFEHDLGVTKVWLSLRESIEMENKNWLLEDDFDDSSIETRCKPDAVIETEDGTPTYIDYCGCYCAQTLRKKWESWIHLDFQLY